MGTFVRFAEAAARRGAACVGPPLSIRNLHPRFGPARQPVAYICAQMRGTRASSTCCRRRNEALARPQPRAELAENQQGDGHQDPVV